MAARRVLDFGANDLSETLKLWGDRPSRRHIQAAVTVAIASIFLLSMNQRVMQPFLQSGHHGLLGRYYVGDQCGETPPHIVRVDPQLNFNEISEMGAMPFPSCDVWRGQLLAPKTGDYEFTIDVDDSGWVTVDGTPVIQDPGSINKSHDAGTIHLTQGPHRIEVGERNLSGGSYLHLFWKLPDSSDQEIVPANALVPDRAGP